MTTSTGEALQPPADLTRAFSLWALHALDFRVEENGHDQFTVYAPEDKPQVFQGAGWVRFHFGSQEAITQSPGVEHLAPGSRMFKWLLDQLKERGDVLHAIPRGQPESVHDLSASLFQAYTVRDGSVRLAGCTLEDRPILRLTYVQPIGATMFHRYVGTDGQVVDPSLVTSLKLADLSPLSDVPANISNELDVHRWREDGNELVMRSESEQNGELDALDPDSQPQLIASTVIWCKRAIGKLNFDIGPESAGLAFDGWASRLASGAELPPPFACPTTGEESYELVLVDEEITVPSALVACEETGERVAPSQLQECPVSKKSVLPGQLECCPVTDQHVLRSILKACGLCGQQVSPDCIQGGRCSACRSLKSIPKEDAQIACVVDKYPKLVKWRKWSVAETPRSTILLAASMTKQVLLLLDKETLEVQRVATAGRFLSKWTELSDDQQAHVLG